jgi:hypothetical protein
MFPWNVIPSTPHISPIAHGNLVVGSSMLIFVHGLKVCCKQITFSTIQRNELGQTHGQLNIIANMEYNLFGFF